MLQLTAIQQKGRDLYMRTGNVEQTLVTVCDTFQVQFHSKHFNRFEQKESDCEIRSLSPPSFPLPPLQPSPLPPFSFHLMVHAAPL